MVRASSTTVPAVRRKASSRAAAARGTRPAAAGTAAVAAVAAATDGDPVGHRACWPPTSVAGARVTRAALAAVRAADRSTRGSTSAVQPSVRMAVLRAAAGGETVCGDTVSSGCGESSRAGGAGRRGTHTGLGVLAGNAPALAAVAADAGTGDWLTPAAMGSTTVSAADGTGLVARTGSRVVSALTST